ncbi:DUF2059 domain-containing protein [Erythrobacter rubeus]|uniref:DUF2059 domain-containing protein n=1 Tax=Erythrobacter rubeus TaxID=2760803 RepID=A0ABR8KY47_9SPHN|nr:DUF2059 domain-containing protein [Erythrobacter rubeus]MBD2843364.1 DUF2059 domain-containing protein [Erythrobacter rubeus]
MKRAFFCAGSALALVFTATSTSAQDASEDNTASELNEFEQAMAAAGTMFAVEPLSAEQEGRLPQASRIVALMIPEGTLAEMMGSTFDQIMGPMIQVGVSAAKTAVPEISGLADDLTDEESEEIAGIFDPAWKERQDAQMAILPAMMTEMMTLMEPSMRTAMSELYAINFSQTELNEIEAFFQTDAGASFARKSFTMSSDPRIIAASMEMMPAMMGLISDMEERRKAVGADLPAKRGFYELSSAEQARVAELLGVTTEEIEAELANADFE